MDVWLQSHRQRDVLTSNWNIMAIKCVSTFRIICKRRSAEYAVFTDLSLLPYVNVRDSGTEYIILYVVHVLLPTLEPSIHNCTLFFLLWSGAVQKKDIWQAYSLLYIYAIFAIIISINFFACLVCRVKSRFWGGQGMYVSKNGLQGIWKVVISDVEGGCIGFRVRFYTSASSLFSP